MELKSQPCSHSTAEGGLAALVGWRGTVAATSPAPASSLGCSQSLSPSTSHSYWAKSVCCCTEKCNRSSAGYLVHPSCRLGSRKRQTHVLVCSGEFQLSLADLRRLPPAPFLSDSPAYLGPAPGTGPAAFQTASLPAPHRLDSP